eukprot:m.29259 g.29259  ORF g.29259 m.29259 type:complete len:956 (+) comp16066_c0_seq1:86-2953(+)
MWNTGMSMIVATLVASSMGDSTLCGSYIAECQLGQGDMLNSAFNGTLLMMGETGGDLTYDVWTWPNTTFCATGETPDIMSSFAGVFNDFGGPLNNSVPDKSLRRTVFNITLGSVTPYTDSAVDALQIACPCGDRTQWVKGNARFLFPGCPPNGQKPGCDLNLFFGGSDLVLLNEALFNVFSVPDGGAIASQHLFAPTVVDGWATNVEKTPYLEWTQDQTCTSTEIGTLCGQYESPSACTATINPFNNSAVGSQTTTLFFRGPLGTLDAPPLNQFGVYNRTRTFFSDFDCSVPVINTYEYGSMGLTAKANNGAGPNYIVSRQASNMIVTPLSANEVTYLEQHCPCGPTGSNWKVGVQRLLTTCPDNTCDQQYWNDYLYLGSQAVAYASRNDTVLDGGTSGSLNWKHLSFSRWNDTEAKLQGYEVIYPLVQDPDHDDQVTCAASSYSSQICGFYESFCSSGVIMIYDSISSVTVTGLFSNDTTGNEGKIYSTVKLYDSGKQCQETSGASALEVSISATGFFSAGNEAAVSGVIGLQSIEVDYTLYTLIPQTDGFIKYINSNVTGCPCGGQWQKGVSRSITSCQPNTCSDNFIQNILPGFLGKPGFGVMQLSNDDQGLRMSTLLDTPEAGYYQGFDADTTISYAQDGCPSFSNTINDNVIGQCWAQPCYVMPSPYSQYESSGHFDILPESATAGPLYTFNKTVYPITAGCIDNGLLVTALFRFYTEGEYTLDTADYSTGIANGKLMTLKPYMAQIEPRSVEGAVFLNTNCSCGTFLQGTIKVFTEPCECRPLEAMLGFPVLTTSSGVIKAWTAPTNNMFKGDDFIRHTQFSAVKPPTSIVFTKQNGDYTSDDVSQCPLSPHRPQPSTGVVGLQGGDVFILLFFISLTVYCGVGMGLNYRRTGGMSNGGTPIIPHLSFWRELPGLISDGLRFTFINFCGLRKSGDYKSFGSANGDYGSL